MGAIEGEGICNGSFVLGREGGRVWVIGREVARGKGGVRVVCFNFYVVWADCVVFEVDKVVGFAEVGIYLGLLGD